MLTNFGFNKTVLLLLSTFLTLYLKLKLEKRNKSDGPRDFRQSLATLKMYISSIFSIYTAF